jgi:hypothetical protein
LGYLLAGFDAFERLGTFNRLHLAGLVSGAEAVEEPLRAASAVLDQWGYRSVLSAKHRVRGVFSQVLLINRSPRLEDLDSAAFDRLHAHPATNATTASCSTRCSARSPRLGTVSLRCAPATTMRPASREPT